MENAATNVKEEVKEKEEVEEEETKRPRMTIEKRKARTLDTGDFFANDVREFPMWGCDVRTHVRVEIKIKSPNEGVPVLKYARTLPIVHRHSMKNGETVRWYVGVPKSDLYPAALKDHARDARAATHVDPDLDDDEGTFYYTARSFGDNRVLNSIEFEKCETNPSRRKYVLIGVNLYVPALRCITVKRARHSDGEPKLAWDVRREPDESLWRPEFDLCYENDAFFEEIVENYEKASIFVKVTGITFDEDVHETWNDLFSI